MATISDFKKPNLKDNNKASLNDFKLPKNTKRGFIKEYDPNTNAFFQALGNLDESALQLGKDIITPLLSPVQTAKDLKSLGSSVINLVRPGEQGNEQLAREVGKFFKDRYGGLENIKKTFATDPVGMLSDVSIIFTGGAALAPKASATANILNKASKIDPIVGATKLVGSGVNLASKAPSKILGMTTGAGETAISTAFRSGQKGGKVAEDFRNNNKGKESVGKVVEDTLESLKTKKAETSTKAEAQEADDTNLSAEEKTFKQRYGDLRRHMQEKEKEFSARLEKLGKQLDAATKNELVLPKSNEEIEAWSKKYPDVAGIVEAIASKKAKEQAASLDKRLKEIEELRVTAKREKAEAELAAIHPDFGEIRSDDTFHEWAKDQPKWVQDALYENVEDAKSVARVIDLYKVDKGITGKPKKSSSDKGAASSVMTKRTTTPNDTEESKYLRESQVAKMSIKEYEKRMDEIMEAQRSGKFIYDVSKK